jgi:protein-S-isoprenylcysteine O-methyltransferase Ste14
MKNDDIVALWQTQSGDGFRMSSEEIRSRIEVLNRKVRRRNLDVYLVCGSLIAFFIGWMIVGMNTLQTVGAVLAIIGISFLAWQIRANGFRSLSIDSSDTLAHLRRELERQRDFHRGSRFWSRMLFFVPGPLVFFAGFGQQHPEVITFIRMEIIAFIILALAAIPLNMWMARRYQKQIDALSRLQEEH